MFQVLTSLVVLWSFVEAVNGNRDAMKLWTEGAEGIAILLGLGVGMKMTAQSAERIAERKYRAMSRPSQPDISTEGEP